jgi:hypothetical protein
MGPTYMGLLAAMRQSELRDEAEKRRRARQLQPQRDNLLGLILPQLRRNR